MKHMTRGYAKEDAMLREHKESTLEKQQKSRQRNKPAELEVNSEYDFINKKINQRLKRKEMLAKELNKLHDPDIG